MGTSSVETSVLLQIVPVNVQTPKGAIKTYTLLDSESQASLIAEEFADKIGLQGEPSILHLGTVNSTHEAKRSEKSPLMLAPLADQMSEKSRWRKPELLSG